MKKIFHLLLLFTFGTTLSQALAQSSGENVSITGNVVNTEGEVLSNASVAIYEEGESEIISGTVADADGEFSLQAAPGNYEIEVSFLSYVNYRESIEIIAGESLDLGTITLQPEQAEMDEVVVEGERSYMEMNFDSRSFNVAEDITSLGGSALDVLDNVPSISVDFEGNVSLRGNQGVQILINGRPSNLVRNGTDALSSIPSSMIEEVKIITNPSARYSADGTGGIIDIILVDDARLGFNGSVRANTGIPQDHSLGANLNYHRNNINWFFNTEFEYELDPRSSRTFQSFSGDTTYAYQERSDWNEREMEGNVYFGADIYLPADQLLTIASRINMENEREDRDVNYIDYNPGNDEVYRSVVDDWGILQETTREVLDENRESDYDVRMQYENRFDGNDHILTADMDFEFGNEDEETNLNELINQGQGSGVEQRTFSKESYREARFDADYERPVGDGGKLEAGFRFNYDWSEDDYLVEELQNGVWVESGEEIGISDNFTYLENVNSLYGIYSGELEPFTYQVGLRAENTRIETELEETGEGSNQNYLNFFPSVFLSYTINEKNSFQGSYSRRISRPWSWVLLPFTEIADNRNRREGNPNLEPEFSDSYELGYLRYWESGSILTSVYYRHRTQVIERVTNIDEQGITTSRPINLATEESWGVEFSADQDLFNDLQLSASLNIYQSNRDGEYEGQVYSSESGSFTSRLRIRWQFMEGWNFQSYLYYRGARQTTQGRRAPRSFVGSAISKELLDGRANISLNVRDLFNTRNSNREVIEPNSYTNSQFSWSSRSFRLNFRYNFGGNDNGGGRR